MWQVSSVSGHTAQPNTFGMINEISPCSSTSGSFCSVSLQPRLCLPWTDALQMSSKRLLKLIHKAWSTDSTLLTGLSTEPTFLWCSTNKYSWNPEANESCSFYKNINLNVGGLLGAAIICLYSSEVHSEGKKHSCIVNILSNSCRTFKVKGLFSEVAYKVRG